MVTIDGRTGGGQLLRTALTLSAVTGTAFELEHVRAERPSPGLKPQHLAAIRTLSALCDAEVEGATPDAETLTFEPDRLEAASQTVDIGTAGSIALLFDAVLPLATAVAEPFELTAIGGTDVKWAPSIEYLRRVKLPLLGWAGLDGEVDLERSGFYPTGGGRASLTVRPSTVRTLCLVDRGPLERVQVFSKASDDLADAEVAERQASRAHERLHESSLHADVESVDYVDAASAGSVLLLRAIYEEAIAGFDALGERGKPSEAVADEAVDRFLAFEDGAGAVDVHMGDQLVVFLALAGGEVHAPRATDHVRSSVDLVGRFGFDVDLEEFADGSVRLTARAP